MSRTTGPRLTLADWDRREAAATDESDRYTPRDAYTHPVLAINLALELGIPEVLLSAFYDLSRYEPSRTLAGARRLPPVSAVSTWVVWICRRGGWQRRRSSPPTAPNCFELWAVVVGITYRRAALWHSV